MANDINSMKIIETIILRLIRFSSSLIEYDCQYRLAIKM